MTELPATTGSFVLYYVMKKFDIKKHLEDLKKLASKKKLTPKERVELYNKSNSKGCNC